MRKVLLILSIFVSTLTGCSFAKAQEVPPPVPAPIFRVPYGYVLQPIYAQDSSSLPVYGPPPPLVYGPALPPPYGVRHRRYYQPWSGPNEATEAVGGLLLALFLLGVLAAQH